MKKALTLILLLVLPLSAHAAATAPATNVWYTPTTAKEGDPIELNAFVYNSTKASATATVVFAHDTTEIGTTTVTIPPATAKVATIHWEKPKNETTVTAEVTKAVSGTKEAPELIGAVGSVTISGTETKQALPVKLTLPSENTVKGWFSSVFGKIEPFRIQEADHYTKLRMDTRDKLGIDKKNDLLQRYEDASQVPGTPSNDTVTEGSLSSARQLNFGLYGTYIFASAMSGLFTNVAVFYITIILLILIILRYTIGQFI